MKAPLLHRARTTIHKVSPVHVVKQANTARVMRHFADDLGFIYFGFVDQQDDDHRLVRGITASNTHSDHHYTVGTYKSYDVSLVVRRDTLVYRDRRVKDHFWTILTVDLHIASELPPIYIGHHTTRELMLAKFASLAALPLDPSNPQLKRFLSTYSLYSQLAHEHEIYALFPPQVLEALAGHIGEMSAEITDGTIYLYLTEKHPTRTALTKMLNFGVWLAQVLDAEVASTTREI